MTGNTGMWSRTAALLLRSRALGCSTCILRWLDDSRSKDMHILSGNRDMHVPDSISYRHVSLIKEESMDGFGLLLIALGLVAVVIVIRSMNK